jgi:hypothetical protein
MLVVGILAIAQAPVPAPAPVAPASTAPPTAPSAPVAEPAKPAEVVYKDGVIKVGSEFKKSIGVVTDVDKGDNGCYLTLKDDKGLEFIEVGKFEICTQKPPLKGKRVALAYNIETIQATSCYGDPKCKKTETIPVVVGVKIAE